jgi:hypothetical protein
MLVGRSAHAWERLGGGVPIAAGEGGSEVGAVTEGERGEMEASMTEQAPVDRFLHDVYLDASGGLDPEVTRRALRDFQEAIAKQAAELKGAKYKRRTVQAKCLGCRTVQKFVLAAADPDVLARASTATAKAADTFARLGEFLSGRADSRPDGGGDWLRMLSDEQIRQVQGWVEANGKGGTR